MGKNHLTTYNSKPSLSTQDVDHQYHHNHHSRSSRTKNNLFGGSSGESAFRDMKHNGSRSTKTVKFPSGRSRDDEDDDDDDEEEEGSNRIPMSPLSTTDSERKGDKFGKFMEQMVSALNSPIKMQRKREDPNKRSRHNKKRAQSRHRRQDSHTVTEYPYSMINLRETSSSPSYVKDLSQRSLEKSPLFNKPFSYGEDHETTAATTLGNYQSLRPSTTTATNSNKIPKPEAGHTIQIRSGMSTDHADDSFGNAVAAWSQQQHLRHHELATRVAAYFLMDYEASRVASLPCTFKTIIVN